LPSCCRTTFDFSKTYSYPEKGIPPGKLPALQLCARNNTVLLMLFPLITNFCVRTLILFLDSYLVQLLPISLQDSFSCYNSFTFSVTGCSLPLSLTICATGSRLQKRSQGNHLRFGKVAQSQSPRYPGRRFMVLESAGRSGVRS
jgi:hypothetical protein